MLGIHMTSIVCSLDWLFTSILIHSKKDTRTAPGRANLTTLGYIPFYFISLSLSFGKSLAEKEAELQRQIFFFLVHITAF